MKYLEQQRPWLFNIHKLKFIVLDEADEILSDGISDKLQEIFDKAPSGIQVILISA